MLRLMIESIVFVVIWCAVMISMESSGVTEPSWYALVGGMLTIGFRSYLDIKVGGA